MDGPTLLGALTSPEGREDPYPIYAAAHEIGPVIPLGGDMFVVTGYEEVNRAFRSPHFGSWDEKYDRPFMPDWREHPSLLSLTQSVMYSNPPEHTRMREVMARTFTARRVAALEPVVGEIADELLDSLGKAGADGSPVDFMEVFSFRLSVGVICELFGMPAEDRPRFRQLGADWTEVFEVMPDPVAMSKADAAYLQFQAYFEQLVEQRRAEPRDDLVTAVVQLVDAEGAPLSAHELVCNLAVLLAAGYETVTNLFGNGLGLLFRFPEVAAQLRQRTLPVESFVEEVLRFDSPVQVSGRVAHTDSELAGTPIPAGGSLILMLGAANRDPKRYPDPDRFDATRTDIQPISFGAGIHHCLGAALARMEGATAFTRLLDRFPSIAPAGSPLRRDRLVLRGYESLPVTLH
jgi:cytochrome P450